MVIIVLPFLILASITISFLVSRLAWMRVDRLPSKPQTRTSHVRIPSSQTTSIPIGCGVHLLTETGDENQPPRLLLRFSGTGGLYQYCFGVCAALQDCVDLSRVDFDTTSGSTAGCFSLCLSLPVLATYRLFEERKRRHVRTHGPLIWASSEAYNLIYYHALSLIDLRILAEPSLLSAKGSLLPNRNRLPSHPLGEEGGSFLPHVLVHGEEEDEEEDERVAAERECRPLLLPKGKHRILTCKREGKRLVSTDEYSSPHEYARAVATTALLALEGGCKFLPGGECDAIWSSTFHLGEEGRDRIPFPLRGPSWNGSEKGFFFPILSFFTGLVFEERVQYEVGYADAMRELVPLCSDAVGPPSKGQPRSTDPLPGSGGTDRDTEGEGHPP